MPQPANHDAVKDVVTVARTHAFDAYLVASLAPLDKRVDLMVLAAFLGEIARIPYLVSEPTLGEIRLQWWRDWLASLAKRPRDGDLKTGNPVADQFAGVVERHDLPVDDLQQLLNVQGDACYPHVVDGVSQFGSRLEVMTGVGLRLRYQILNGAAPTGDLLCALKDAAQAIGVLETFLRLPKIVARSSWPLPLDGPVPDVANIFLADHDAARGKSVGAAVAYVREHLTRVRAQPRRVRQDVWPSILEIALVAPHLRALDVAGFDPTRDAVTISPLSRMCRLWWTKHRKNI